MRLLRVTGVLAAALFSGVLTGAIPAGAKGAGGGISGAATEASSVTGPPGSPLRYAAIAAGSSTTSVLAIETQGGEIRRQRAVAGRWALPRVTLRDGAGGLSADGETLVLIRPDFGSRDTRYLTLDALSLRTEEKITLDGEFAFDAISPDGRLMYLIEYPRPRYFLEYRVRAFDVAAGELRPGAVVDPDEAGEPMTGEPVSRAMSPDGRWAYTLYRGEETFVHALDTEAAAAVCIDVPQLEDANFFALDLSVDPSSGALTVLDRGDPAMAIDPQTFEVEPVSEADTAAAGGDGAAWLVWTLIGGGLILSAGAVTIRRRRRRDAALGSGLEEALRDDTEELEPEERPREPVA